MSFLFLHATHDRFIARDGGAVSSLSLVFPDDFPDLETLPDERTVEIDAIYARLTTVNDLAMRRLQIDLLTDQTFPAVRWVSSAATGGSLTRQYQFSRSGVAASPNNFNEEHLPSGLVLLQGPTTLRISVVNWVSGDQFEEVLVSGRFRDLGMP